MSHRLFIAISLPKDWLEVLARMQHREQRLRWTRVETMHLTLRFIGNVEEDAIPAISDALGHIAMPRFTLEMTNVSAFPNERHPRVIYVGANGGDELMSLAEQVNRAIEPVIGPADLPFRPHITLARVERDSERDARVYFAEEQTPPADRFVVERFSLFESHLHPGGARHEVLASFPLRS
jgi:RNA 2',3'-cyclic 3'-phosphodiesterase